MFICFDMIHERDRRTDRHRMPTYTVLMHMDRAVKMIQQDRIIELDREDHIKDLGVIFDENLDFGMRIAERINKAYSMSIISMLWLIKRNFKDTGREAFLLHGIV